MFSVLLLLLLPGLACEDHLLATQRPALRKRCRTRVWHSWLAVAAGAGPMLTVAQPAVVHALLLAWLAPTGLAPPI